MGGMGYDEVGLGVRIGEGLHEVCGLICVCDGCVQHFKEVSQQGKFESVHRDVMVMFSEWPFTPMGLDNPFEIPVHIWQGTEDYLVPANLQKHVASSLAWVTYHELPGYGHFLNLYPGYPEKVVRSLVEDSNKRAFAL